MSGMMHQSKIVVNCAGLPLPPAKQGVAALGLCGTAVLRLAYAGLMASALVGCGQKGTLYLPAPAQAPAHTPLNASSAPTP
jgi:predicted small lipoprotein YifL